MIRVRTNVVEALLNAADWNYAELSRRMCMDQSSVTRLLQGEEVPGKKRRQPRPGPRSIASLLWAFRAFPKVGFENLFEVFDGKLEPGFEEDESDDDAVEAISA